MEKTDLKKIFAVSGQRGLFEYVSQARNGVVVESLLTKQRTSFSASSKVTSLGDISIYTVSDEVPLKKVLENMAAKLEKGPAMSSKSDDKKIREFFGEVLPEYDADRFYLSHMKKVLDWYNVLQQYASLDFVSEEEENGDAKKE